MTDKRRQPKSRGVPLPEGAAFGIADGGVFPLFRADGSIAEQADFERAFVDRIEQLALGSAGRWIAARHVGIMAGETYAEAARVLTESLAATRPERKRKDLKKLATEFWSHLQRRQGGRGWTSQSLGKFEELAGAVKIRVTAAQATALEISMTAALAAALAARRIIVNIQVLEEHPQAGNVSLIFDRRPASLEDGTKDQVSLVPGPAISGLLALLKAGGGADRDAFERLSSNAAHIAALSVTSEAEALLIEAREALASLAAVKGRNKSQTEKAIEKRTTDGDWRRRIVLRLMIALRKARPNDFDDYLIRNYLRGLVASVESHGQDAASLPGGVGPSKAWDRKLIDIEKRLWLGISDDELKSLCAPSEGTTTGQPEDPRRVPTAKALRGTVGQLKANGSLSKGKKRAP